MPRNGLLVTIKGERAKLYETSTGISAIGYDLVNEKIGLTLSGGYGEGIGVLLVALNEIWEFDYDLEEEIIKFNKDVRNIEQKQNWVWPESQLTHPYYSFSPNAHYRHRSASRKFINNAGWKRLMGDTDVRVVLAGLVSSDIPHEWLEKASHSIEPLVRLWAARAPRLSEKSMERLSRDELDIKLALLQNPNLTLSLRQILEDDKDVQQANEGKKSMLEIYLGNKGL